MAPATLDLHFQGVPGVIAVYLLETADGLALVDVGPASTLPALEAGLHSLGHALSHVRHLLITHVHLDHAGAAGEIAARTGAWVYVQARGLRHLASPDRLLASAGQIYGEHMDRLWGEMRSVSEGQLVPLEGGEALDLGGLTVRPIYTPGHAIHHLAYQVGDDLFVGDVGGIRLSTNQTPRAPTPPPDIDLEAWQGSVARLRETGARTLHLAHFGNYPATADHWDGLLATMELDAQGVRAGLEEGLDPEALSAQFTAELNADLAAQDPELPARFAFASPAWMSVQGLTRYWTRRARRAGA